MPFELGLNHGSKLFGIGAHIDKAILVLEGERYDSQRALSDIAGWDVEAHRNGYQTAVRKVHRWLRAQTAGKFIGPDRILGHYIDFSGCYWHRELASGASEDDIKEYPSIDVVRAMHDWLSEVQPMP